jgi:hypothetical protein
LTLVKNEVDSRGQLRRSGRVFAFTLMGGFMLVAAVGYWRGSRAVQVLAQVLAIIAFAAGILIPERLEPVRKAWMKVGETIGHVTTPVFLAVVYYGVLTPTGLVRRIAARRRATRESAWHERPPLPRSERMERQF